MVEETLALVLGILLGFAASVVYELKYLIQIDKNLRAMLDRLQNIGVVELKEMAKEEEMMKDIHGDLEKKRKSKSK